MQDVSYPTEEINARVILFLLVREDKTYKRTKRKKNAVGCFL